MAGIFFAIFAAVYAAGTIARPVRPDIWQDRFTAIYAAVIRHTVYIRAYHYIARPIVSRGPFKARPIVSRAGIYTRAPVLADHIARGGAAIIARGCLHAPVLSRAAACIVTSRAHVVISRAHGLQVHIARRCLPSCLRAAGPGARPNPIPAR